VYAPTDKFAKHCKKSNEGSPDKPAKANKGYFGCARKCRFFVEVKK